MTPRSPILPARIAKALAVLLGLAARAPLSGRRPRRRLEFRRHPPSGNEKHRRRGGPRPPRSFPNPEALPADFKGFLEQGNKTRKILTNAELANVYHSRQRDRARERTQRAQHVGVDFLSGFEPGDMMTDPARNPWATELKDVPNWSARADVRLDAVGARANAKLGSGGPDIEVMGRSFIKDLPGSVGAGGLRDQIYKVLQPLSARPHAAPGFRGRHDRARRLEVAVQHRLRRPVGQVRRSNAQGIGDEDLP